MKERLLSSRWHIDMKTLSTVFTFCEWNPPVTKDPSRERPVIRNADALLWRHNEHDSVSNHQPHDCLLNRLFRHRSKKTSKPRVTGLYAGNSPETGEFPAQMASNAENASIWWRHHGFHYFQPDQVVECQRSYWSLETLWRSLNIIVIVSSSISAIVTSVCLVVYIFLVYDGPDTHPRISWRERRYIESGVGHLEGVGRWSNKLYMYRQIFNIRCTKSKKRNVSRLVLQLFCVTYWSQVFGFRFRFQCLYSATNCADNIPRSLVQ